MVDGIYRPLMAVGLDSHCSHADRTLSRPCPAQKRKNFVSRARTTSLRSVVLSAWGPKDRWAGVGPASASPSGPAGGASPASLPSSVRRPPRRVGGAPGGGALPSAVAVGPAQPPVAAALWSAGVCGGCSTPSASFAT